MGRKRCVLSLNYAKLFPLVQQIGSYLKLAADHYADLREVQADVDADTVALFLQAKMAEWDPKVAGKRLLDDDTRAAGARFLAGVAVNFSKG